MVFLFASKIAITENMNRQKSIRYHYIILTRITFCTIAKNIYLLSRCAIPIQWFKRNFTPVIIRLLLSMLISIPYINFFVNFLCIFKGKNVDY